MAAAVIWVDRLFPCPESRMMPRRSIGHTSDHACRSCERSSRANSFNSSSVADFTDCVVASAASVLTTLASDTGPAMRRDLSLMNGGTAHAARAFKCARLPAQPLGQLRAYGCERGEIRHDFEALSSGSMIPPAYPARTASCGAGALNSDSQNVQTMPPCSACDGTTWIAGLARRYTEGGCDRIRASAFLDASSHATATAKGQLCQEPQHRTIPVRYDVRGPVRQRPTIATIQVVGIGARPSCRHHETLDDGSSGLSHPDVIDMVLGLHRGVQQRVTASCTIVARTPRAC